MQEIFLVVEPLFVQSNVGVVLALKSSLHQQMPLAWKKEQFFSPTTTAFIKYAKEYFKR